MWLLTVPLRSSAVPPMFPFELASSLYSLGRSLPIVNDLLIIVRSIQS